MANPAFRETPLYGSDYSTVIDTFDTNGLPTTPSGSIVCNVSKDGGAVAAASEAVAAVTGIKGVKVYLSAALMTCAELKGLITGTGIAAQPFTIHPQNLGLKANVNRWKDTDVLPPSSNAIHTIVDTNADKSGYGIATLGTNAIDVGTLTQAALDAFVTNLLKFNPASPVITGEAKHSFLNLLRFCIGQWSISGTTLTVLKEDGTTVAFTMSLTAPGGGNPILGSGGAV